MSTIELASEQDTFWYELRYNEIADIFLTMLHKQRDLFFKALRSPHVMIGQLDGHDEVSEDSSTTTQALEGHDEIAGASSTRILRLEDVLQKTSDGLHDMIDQSEPHFIEQSDNRASLSGNDAGSD